MRIAQSGRGRKRGSASLAALVLYGFAAILPAALCCCSARSSAGLPVSNSEGSVIQNIGSDTMVNVAQAWAEEYAAAEPAVSVEVSGGGSGTGIAALIEGTVDIANCSRRIEPKEIEAAVRNTGKTPREVTVGYDALAVYVNKDNALEHITLEQLAEIYGEKASLTKWSQLGARLPPRAKDAIIVVSRQSNAGTYFYFREAVLGKKRDFRLGTIDMLGSKDVVELVSRTPSAIGYSGMGYATQQVKMLRVARGNGETAYAPTIENTLSGKYPIARPLFMYTLGEPGGRIRKYLDWILSGEGQGILARSGYVPLKAQ
jgi:phosphate transport system substrate-binding protein